MARLLQFMHRRSLSVSIVALLLSLPALGFVPEFAQRLQWFGSAFLIQASMAVVVALFVCIVALTNLLGDVRRGYSPALCSLAAVLLFLAIAPAVLVGVQVLRHAGGFR